MPAPSERRAARVGWSATAVLWLGCLGIGGPFFDALSEGPYTRWYNRHKLEQAQAAGLVGQPESAIIPALGQPTDIWRSSRGAESIITYNYAPCFFAPYGQFQVHVRNGHVSRLEQLDY